MNNGKQSEQLLKVLGGHSASLDRTSKCRGLSEQPLYSGGQSIVSLTISLRHKFVKQISAKVTNTLFFFLLKKCENPLHCNIFSTKYNSVFVILMFEILTKR